MNNIQFGEYSVDNIFIDGQRCSVECGNHVDELECRFADGGVYIKIKNPSNRIQKYITDKNLFLSTAFFNSRALGDYDHGSKNNSLSEGILTVRDTKWRNARGKDCINEEWLRLDRSVIS